MRLVWTTDPHLNHVPVSAWERWIGEILDQRGDALLVTGDISEGDDVVFELCRLAEAVDQSIYFVLGNHDFYQSSIATTRRRVMEICREHSRLTYLTDAQPMELLPGCFLIGEDGWGDATQGDYHGSPVRLNDFRLIDDFRRIPQDSWRERLTREGMASAERLRQKLDSLPPHATNVVCITHVPPYRDACWYEGHTTDDWWAPFFVCGAVGSVLSEFSESHPSIQMTTLCGHTHHPGVARIESNHVVHTGAAEYGVPRVEAVVSVNGDQVTVKPVHH